MRWDDKKIIKRDLHGRELVKGFRIQHHIDGPLLTHIKASCASHGLVWEEIVERCTLLIDRTEHCSLMYNIGKWPFSGKLLLTFNKSPKYDYRVSYPQKGIHLKYILEHLKYYI